MPVALTLALPAVWKIILYLGAGVVGIVASYVLGKFLVKWGNEYKDGANATTATNARSETQQADQTANQESDALKKIDGR